jgi:hypothetical protein
MAESPSERAAIWRTAVDTARQRTDRQIERGLREREAAKQAAENRRRQLSGPQKRWNGPIK